MTGLPEYITPGPRITLNGSQALMEQLGSELEAGERYATALVCSCLAYAFAVFATCSFWNFFLLADALRNLFQQIVSQKPPARHIYRYIPVGIIILCNKNAAPFKTNGAAFLCYKGNAGLRAPAVPPPGMELHRQRKEGIMPISENITDFIKRYKRAHHFSVAELSEELGIAKSALAGYLSGTCNPRTDTLELLAEKRGVSVAEIISAHPRDWERAEMAERAARLFSSLPPERRDRAIHLFLDLIDTLSEDHS